MKTDTRTAHTPGPWRVSKCSLGTKALIEHGDESARSPIIGSVYSDGGALPTEANARLIAAAPELAESLREVTAYLADIIHDWEESNAGDIMVAEARALLARIDGERSPCEECGESFNVDESASTTHCLRCVNRGFDVNRR